MIKGNDTMTTDLKTFKDQIKQKLRETSFENKELHTRWRQIRQEQDELLHLYKPRNKLTLKGFVKVCPNDGAKLSSQVVAREWSTFGLWEYTILSCSTCGYEYAVSKNIRSQ